MLSKNTQINRDQIEMIALDELVPADHMVRKIEAAVDFSFIYSLVEDLYSTERERSSIDPVVFIKMAFIQYTFGIRSMRQTIKEIETNMAYRWFLGFGFYTEVPHFSTYLEEAEHLRHNDEIRQIYARRKETIERVFADAKEKHGMRWTTLRGLKKLSMQAMLTFAAMNLKKLANWTWQLA